jgi:hypothetical protein
MDKEIIMKYGDTMPMGAGVSTCKQGSIPHYLGRLEEEIEINRSIISTLHEKLDPVLAPDQPKNPMPEEVSPALPEVAYRLLGLFHQVSKNNNHLRELIERCEL